MPIFTKIFIMIEYAAIGLLVIILLVLVLLFFKKPQQSVALISIEDFEKAKAENDLLKIALARVEERVANLSTEKEHITILLQQEQQRLIDELQAERDRLADANRELESTRSFYLAEKEKLAEQKLSYEQSQEKLNKDFELIANKILEEKSTRFVEQNRTNLDLILNQEFLPPVKLFQVILLHLFLLSQKYHVTEFFHPSLQQVNSYQPNAL